MLQTHRKSCLQDKNQLMHPFSVLTLGIFIAGYITARWDLVTRLYELAIFAAEHSVVVSSLCAWSKHYLVSARSYTDMKVTTDAGS